MKLILGSQSKGRRGVLEKMGYTFAAMHADIDEQAIRCDDPQQLTLAIANAKADALLSKIAEPAILLTTDTVVVCDGKILEKPKDADEARQCLRKYANHPAETVTAVVAVNTATKKRAEGVDVSRVWLRPIPEDVIEKIIDSGEVFTWAGAFAVQHPLVAPLIDRIEGTLESVIGLPVELTKRLIGEVQL